MKNKNLSLKQALANYAINYAGEKNVIVNPKDGGAYFCDFRNNIYQNKMEEKFIDMFLDGDGNELYSKAAAAHSSSMLGFNFFHWINETHPIVIQFGDDIKKYNNVVFEEKLTVLKGTKPSNMDIILSNSEGDILFIESKFLEYQKKDTFDISETYKKDPKNRYLTRRDFWMNFIEQYDATQRKQYWSGIKQDICHMIAIINWIDGETEVLGRKYSGNDVRFVNLVFSPNNELFKKEASDFYSYKKLYEQLRSKFDHSGKIPPRLKYQFMSYSEIWPFITNVIDPELKSYLIKHYMTFANPTYLPK